MLLSNGFPYSKIRLKKFDFSLKIVPANIVQKLPSQRCSKPLLIAFFNFSHKWLTFAFTDESGYTLGFQRRIAHEGTHGETGGVLGGGWYHYPRSVLRGSETLRGRVSERQTLPLLGLGRGVLPKNAESLRNSDALMRVAVPKCCGPAGLRDPVSALWIMW